MRAVRLAVLILFFVAGPAAASPSGAPPEPVESALAAAFDRLAGEGYSGAVAVRRDGEEVFAAASGTSGPNDAYTTDTRALIGSVSKPVTAIAVLMLVERGDMSLNDKITRWFPDAPKDKRAITLEDLLAHTSGIVDFPEGVGDYTPMTADDMAARLLAADLTHRPGLFGRRTFEYSNGGYNLLGIIVEKQTGASFGDFLRDEIFAPLGLEAGLDPTGFEAPVAQAMNVDLDWQDPRDFADPAKGPFWGLWGAGGVYMSAPEFARLIDAFFAGEIVGDDLVRDSMRARASFPAFGGRAGMGLGWLIVTTERGAPLYLHTGGSDLFNAEARHYPDEGVTITAQANVRAPSALLAGRVLSAAILGPDFAERTAKRPEGEALPPDSPERLLIEELFAAGFQGVAAADAFVARYFSRPDEAEERRLNKRRFVLDLPERFGRPDIVWAVRAADGAVMTVLRVDNGPDVGFRYLRITSRPLDDGGVGIGQIETGPYEELE